MYFLCYFLGKTKMRVQSVVAILSVFFILSEAAVTVEVISGLSTDNTIECGKQNVIRCVVSPFPGTAGYMAWNTDSKSLTTCYDASDNDCTSMFVDHYTFSSSLTDKTFNLTFNTVKLSDGSVEFRCTDTITTDTVKPNVALMPHPATTTNSSSGLELEVTTGCVYPNSSITFEWYYMDNGERKVLSIKSEQTLVSTGCTTGDCGGADVKKITSRLTTDSEGEEYNIYVDVIHADAPENDPNYVVTKSFGMFKVAIAQPEEDKDKCDTDCKTGAGVGSGGGIGILIGIGCAAAWHLLKKKVWNVVIRNDGTWQEGTCHVGPSNGANCVQEVRRGGPADKKLKKGDRILSINGKSTTGKSIENINKQLKIPPTVLELTIKRGEDKKHVTLDFKGKSSSGIAIKKEKEDIVVSTIEPESAAAISGEIQEQDCILSVNGVSTAGMKVEDIKEMLTFSIILKVTEDFTLKELDPDKDGSFGFETFLPSTSTSVTVNNQTAVTTVTPERPANVVKSVTTNGPADLHGIKAGDKIVSINNEETKGKSHQEIKAMLETFGTSISLKIEKNDKPNQTNGRGGYDIEMGYVNPRPQDSGSSPQ